MFGFRGTHLHSPACVLHRYAPRLKLYPVWIGPHCPRFLFSDIHVRFECTGSMDADVDVVINFNITIHSVSNITSIQIKRKKACRMRTYLFPSDDKTPVSGGRWPCLQFVPEVCYTLRFCWVKRGMPHPRQHTAWFAGQPYFVKEYI